MIVVTGNALLDRESVEKLRSLVTDVQLIEGTRGALSMFSARQPAPGDGLPEPVFPKPLPQGPAHHELVERALTNDIIHGRLLSADGRLALVVLSLEPATVDGGGPAGVDLTGGSRTCRSCSSKSATRSNATAFCTTLSEGPRQAQAAGHLNLAGSGLPDGSDASVGADLRSRLPSELYAYRPGRDARQAVVEVEELVFRGHPGVVDADLADYFGSIPMPTFSSRQRAGSSIGACCV